MAAALDDSFQTIRRSISSTSGFLWLDLGIGAGRRQHPTSTEVSQRLVAPDLRRCPYSTRQASG
jgi:hypothetical protein